MLPLLLLLLKSLDLVSSSWGDQSSYFRGCVRNCQENTCSSDHWLEGQGMGERLLGWSCPEDCGYFCMWDTVEVMQKRHGQVPQFHGKWPFVRVWGVQEPASVLFSMLNLLTNGMMLRWFLSRVPSSSPMYWVWVTYSLTAINSWVWSIVFHARDTPTTEMMDYFSAFSTVLFSLLAFFLRMLVGQDNQAAMTLVTSLILAFFYHHLYQMAWIKFDYGYNMTVNVIVGAVNCLSWLVWLFREARREGAEPHILAGVMAIVLVAASVGLELLDFPPLMWVLDSHSLWHLATAPLPLLWFRFVVGDCLKLTSDKGGEKKIA